MSDQRETAALDVSGLTVRYGPRTAVRSLDLRIARGEFLALVGESGSGKSTTAAAVTGLLPHSAAATGSVRLGRVDILCLPERRLSGLRGRAVGLIPQDPGASLNPVRTIGAQLAEVLEVRRNAGEPRLSRAERRRRCLEMLETAEVSRAESRLHQLPHELSGGLKQRVLIAMAFGLDPRLIVADEPTSALDVTVQRQVLTVFDRLAQAHGTSVLFVTHDIALASDHADRLAIMRHGTILEEGPTVELVAAPHTPYARSLLDHARPVEAPSRQVAEAPVVLSAEGLVKRFADGHRAVDGVSLELRRGRTLALVGESGSGKSTTARLLLRLLDPDAGRIVVDEREVTQVSGRARRDLWRTIQLVHQNPDSSLDPRWRIREIVGEPLRGRLPRSRARARVSELLAAVDLGPEIAVTRPSALSGGQRQRVAIARALAAESRILVLDEALSALDVITQESILRLLQDLQRDLGLAYVFISHDLSVVRRIAHEVIVLREGAEIERGDVEQIFHAPEHEYTRGLLAAIPGITHLHRADDGTHHDLEVIR